MPVLALFVPTATQCLTVAGPFLGVFALAWLVRHGDELVEEIFPHWRWERQLGWLNLRAYRRAESVLRWIRHFVHAGLLFALVGILWNASVLGNFDQWDDSTAVGYFFLHLSILLVCVAVWIVYLATVLAPKIRAEYEREELERFRRENPDPLAEEAAVRNRGVGSSGGITIWESPVGPSPKRR
jgi:hypothetical protein